MPAVSNQYLLDTFEDALENDYIQPYFQPVVRTISRQACSFEALARWEDPRYGLIQPDRFIGLLEENKLIHKLDAHIVRQACAVIRRNIDEGFYPTPISVNLSRLDFELCDIFAVVDGIAKEYRVPPNFLFVEITESLFSENEEKMRQVVDTFRSAGYQIWMDDFGSGYSSLNTLKDYTFDELKVDMHFLSTFHLRSRKILTAVINMAKDIEIHTLVEGVETEDQFRFLQDIGCEKVQGYLFGKPRPYDKMIDHLRRIKIPLEHPRDRRYYDDLGLVNILSSAPFMSREQRNSLNNARELNSIPLALTELRGESFQLLYYNAAFERTAADTHWGRDIFAGNITGRQIGAGGVPHRLARMLEEARITGEAKLYFISDGDYYELRAKRVAWSQDICCVLLQLDNLSRSLELDRLNTLDTEMRHIYAIFDRVSLFDFREDRVSPLYVGTHDEKVSSDGTIRSTLEQYAKTFVFPEDRQEFLRFCDADTMQERILRSGSNHIVDFFRALDEHGQYTWRQYVLVRIRPDAVFCFIRDSDSDVRTMRSRFLTMFPPKPFSELTDGRLWKSMTQSDIGCLYWKDEERRYVGASKRFLDTFGFSSVDELRGKTDEEIGWHLLTEHVVNNEQRVLREGQECQNVPVQFILGGVDHDRLFSCAPVYNEYGRIIGLVGSLDSVPEDGAAGDDGETGRLDGLTGLFNTRGIAEELNLYTDMFYLRRQDFVRIHVAIEDFTLINSQYGFGHGDKVIRTLGEALRGICGTRAVLGRSSGYRFVILRQFGDRDEIVRMIGDIKHAAAHLGEVDGIPCMLYVSVGVCAFSETEDRDRQEQAAETRRLADQNENVSIDSRISRATELFQMYDHLPVAFAVYRVRQDPVSQEIDAEFFYVNHRFSREQHKTPDQLIGRNLKEVFPTLEPEWYEMAKRAALLSQEVIVDKIYFDCMKTNYYVTASQIIRLGYCAFTYQPLDGPFATLAPGDPDRDGENDG